MKSAIDNKIALPNELLETEECIRPLFDPESNSALSIIPSQLKERYDQLVDDCEEKIEHIEDATKWIALICLPVHVSYILNFRVVGWLLPC